MPYIIAMQNLGYSKQNNTKINKQTKYLLKTQIRWTRGYFLKYYHSPHTYMRQIPIFVTDI